MSKQFQFKLVLLGKFSKETRDVSLSIFCIDRRVRRGQIQVYAQQSRSPAISYLCPSSLVLRFVKDQFDDYRESTIGGLLGYFSCVIISDVISGSSCVLNTNGDS
jgi:hypothetical protein